MKKILFIFLVVFALFMSYVFVGGYAQKVQKEHNVNQISTTPKVTSPAAATTTFTVADVAKHNSSSDCWLIINNNVYDVTSFLGDHPGGAYTIIPYCGMEATRAFDTKDRGPNDGHSAQATQMLGDYLVGSIKAN